jgi:acetolactate synthase regulatory subunit
MSIRSKTDAQQSQIGQIVDRWRSCGTLTLQLAAPNVRLRELLTHSMRAR